MAAVVLNEITLDCTESWGHPDQPGTLIVLGVGIDWTQSKKRAAESRAPAAPQVTARRRTSAERKWKRILSF